MSEQIGGDTDRQHGRDTHGTDTGIGSAGSEALDEDTSVLGRNDTDDTGGYADDGSAGGSQLPGYGDQGEGGTAENNDPLTATGDGTDEAIARRRGRAPDQVLDTGMGHFGGAGASGGTGPDIGRSGPDL